MSAWSKQAVPLIFFEQMMASIVEHNGHRATVRNLNARVEKWLKGCWAVLQAAKHKPDDSKAVAKAQNAAKVISHALIEAWRDGIQTNSEGTVAMVIIAEDTLDSMPVRHPARKAWKGLVMALYAMWKVTDPKEADILGYERGKRIARTVLEAAQ